MKTADKCLDLVAGYTLRHPDLEGNNESFVKESRALRAIEIAQADAIADGDRRVAEAKAEAERYKNMLVTAILRSGRRQPLSPNAMSA